MMEEEDDATNRKQSSLSLSNKMNATKCFGIE